MELADSPSWIIDVAEADFEREVLERSRHTPVVVDFWASWCGPCRALGPILERLAQEHAGAFVLARIDVDGAPKLAQELGVRSIPAVLGLRDGGIVAEFVGAQPESAVREFLSAVLPTPADELAHEAAESEAHGDAAQAEARYRQALELETHHPRALLGLARLLAPRDAPAALALLELLPGSGPEAAEAERLAAELRTRTASGDEAALRATLAKDPDDLEARLALGRLLAATGRHEEALQELLGVVERDRDYGDQAARKTMLDVFAVLGGDHPLTQRYRSDLARLLFR